jgi:hypothetical protein
MAVGFTAWMLPLCGGSILMRKFILGLVSAGLFCVMGVSVAAPSAPTFKWQSGNHLFAGVGADAYRLGIPKLHSDFTDVNGKPVSYVRFDKITPRFHGVVGVHFVNNKFLTTLMGHQNAITVNYSYVHERSKQSRNLHDATGYMWNITNGLNNVENPPSTIILQNSVVTGVFTNQNIHLAWTGQKQLAPNVSFSPSAELVYVHQFEKLTSWTNFVTPGPADLRGDLSTTIHANYFGLGFGGAFHYQMMPRLVTTLGLNVQLLVANADYNGWQNFSVQNSPAARGIPGTINGSIHQNLTYRATLHVAANYALLRSANSPFVQLSAGLDNWGWQPKLVGPASGETLHLSHVNVLNWFAGLQFVVPFA